jgi:hypothetical protein
MKTTKLFCNKCNKEFERSTKSYNQAIRNKRTNFFCSLTCSAAFNNSNRDKTSYVKSAEHIKQYCNNRNDIFSKFRRFISSAKFRTKTCDLTLEYLSDLWNSQQGICPYTKIKMSIEKSTVKSNKLTLKHASLDRIDSSLGYIQGNVEFVCLFINYAKNTHSKQDVLDFIKNINIPNNSTT